MEPTAPSNPTTRRMSCADLDLFYALWMRNGGDIGLRWSYLKTDQDDLDHPIRFHEVELVTAAGDSLAITVEDGCLKLERRIARTISR